MRVLLIHPPDNKVSLTFGRLEPLALEVLAATIPEHEVQILDLRIDNIHELDHQLSYFKPNVTGITVNNTIHVKPARRILNHIRSREPHVIQLVGGHHPTMLPEDFHMPCVNIVFLGWAEKSFPEFIDSLARGKDFDQIQGIEIVENGQLSVRNENPNDMDASDIPYPRRELIKKYHKKYRSDMGFRTALVNTTRGCTNRCTFCSVWRVNTGRVLIRRPEDVYHEIVSLPHHINHIFFADDNTFMHPENHEKLCYMIRKAKIRKKYSGYCRSDIIIKFPDLMEAWKKIGLENLCVGFEGTDNKKLEELNKRNIVSRNEEAARILNKIGIPFRPHFLIDPSFDKEDFRRIIQYVRQHRLTSPIFPILTPIPGTDQYVKAKSRIYLDYDYFDFAHAVVPTKMRVRDFYRAWIHLYHRSYPVGRNLIHFFRKKIAGIIGNRKMEEKNQHMRLVNLFLLRFFSIFLHFKLVRHYTWLEKRLGKI